MRIRNIIVENITYFIEDSMMRGTIVGSVEPNRLQRSQHLANKWSLCPINSGPIGILLNDVVNLDLMRQHINSNRYQVQKGGKVSILTQGNIIVKMDKKLKLPIDQPIYVNRRDNRLTWRAIGPRIGRVEERQDIDGFVNIYVNFNRC